VDWSEGMGNIKDIIEYVRDVSKWFYHHIDLLI
jgi:hypothetical protein